MSRTYKDVGRNHKYACSDSKGHAIFTKMCRRRRRNVETYQLEPQPKHKVQYMYFD